MSDMVTVEPSEAPGPSINALLDGPISRSGLRKKPNRPLEVLWFVLGLGVIAGLVYGVAVLLGSTVLSPQAWAERYVSLIAEGDFAEASALVDPLLDPDQLVLLEGATPSATIEDIVITPLSESGPLAKVHVAFSVNGVAQETELSLWRRLSFFGLASEWRVSTPLYGSLQLTSTGPGLLRVGGVELSVLGGVSYAAYPGVYPVELAEGDAYFELAAPIDATVPVNDSIEVPVTATATPVYDEAAVAAVNAIIDECAASTDIAPIGCPFGALLYDEYQKLSWKITDYPVVEISADGTRFESSTQGRAFAKFQQEDFAGRGWVDASYADKFTVTGTLSVVDGRVVAVFDDGAGGAVG